MPRTPSGMQTSTRARRAALPAEPAPEQAEAPHPELPEPPDVLPPPPVGVPEPQEPQEEDELISDIEWDDTSESEEDPDMDILFPPMPQPDLGDPEPDDDGDGDGSESSSSVPSSDSDINEGEESTEQGEAVPIPMGVLENKVAFQIPFRDKLQSFGLSEFQANLIVLNGDIFQPLLLHSVLQCCPKRLLLIHLTPTMMFVMGSFSPSGQLCSYMFKWKDRSFSNKAVRTDFVKSRANTFGSSHNRRRHVAMLPNKVSQRSVGRTLDTTEVDHEEFPKGRPLGQISEQGGLLDVSRLGHGLVVLIVLHVGEHFGEDNWGERRSTRKDSDVRLLRSPVTHRLEMPQGHEGNPDLIILRRISNAPVTDMLGQVHEVTLLGFDQIENGSEYVGVDSKLSVVVKANTALGSTEGNSVGHDERTREKMET